MPVSCAPIKDLLCALAALLLLAGSPAAAAPELPPELEGVPVLMLTDLSSGRVLMARQADLSYAPASVTKVMTAYVAFEEMSEGRLSPLRRFEVRPETSKQWYGEGTSMYLLPEDRPTAHELLRGIMTASANDASVVLAEGYAGSLDGFLFLMNDAARRLGMSKSRYNTPNGWPDQMQTYVSARDLTKLAHSMIERFPRLYRRYSGRLTFDWKDRTLYSHDPITGKVLGADGIKTGYTRAAGYNFLGSAERNGRRLVMVVGGARSARERNAAALALIEWGFSEWRTRRLFDAGQVIGMADVQDGTARTVPLATAAPVRATLADGGNEAVSLEVRYDGPLKAPIRQGERVAELTVHAGDAPSVSLPLYAARDIGKAGVMDRIVNAFMRLVA